MGPCEGSVSCIFCDHNVTCRGGHTKETCDPHLGSKSALWSLSWYGHLGPKWSWSQSTTFLFLKILLHHIRRTHFPRFNPESNTTDTRETIPNSRTHWTGYFSLICICIYVLVHDVTQALKVVWTTKYENPKFSRIYNVSPNFTSFDVGGRFKRVMISLNTSRSHGRGCRLHGLSFINLPWMSMLEAINRWTYYIRHAMHWRKDDMRDHKEIVSIGWKKVSIWFLMDREYIKTDNLNNPKQQELSTLKMCSANMNMSLLKEGTK